MFRYFIRRLLLVIPVVLGVSIAVFTIMRLVPGDPVAIMFGDASTGGRSASAEEYERLRSQLGLNDPMPIQYLRWLQRIAVGDFGKSLIDGRPVSTALVQRLPATMQLASISMLVACCFAIPVGIAAAVKKNSKVDKFAIGLASLSVSVPAFWLALLMIILFSVRLGWLPTGMLPPKGFWESTLDIFRGSFVDMKTWLQHFMMPVLALAFSMLASLIQITRFSMLEVLDADYVRTAKAKGLAPRTVLLRHAFRTAIIPILTVVGLQFAYLLSGTVLIETIFRWPGIGTLGYNAMRRQDYPTVQGVVLIVGIMFAVVNLMIDMLYVFIDPRVQRD